MNELLERLVKADPEHFSIDEITHPMLVPGGIRWRDDEGITIGAARIDWPFAGWCLEQMQARWKEIGADGGCEADVLYWLFTERERGWLDVTTDSIISAYCEWKESTKETPCWMPQGMSTDTKRKPVHVLKTPITSAEIIRVAQDHEGSAESGC